MRINIISGKPRHFLDELNKDEIYELYFTTDRCLEKLFLIIQTIQNGLKIGFKRRDILSAVSKEVYGRDIFEERDDAEMVNLKISKIFREATKEFFDLRKKYNQ